MKGFCSHYFRLLYTLAVSAPEAVWMFRAAASALRKLGNSKGGFFSTYPGTADRPAKMEKLAAN